MSKNTKDNELFEQELSQIDESEIRFPIYVKSKKGTIYSCYFNDERFEELTISKENESFKGCIHYGFNEQIFSMNKDIKLWYYTLMRAHEIVSSEEYDRIFNMIVEGRTEFFTSDNQQYIEVVHPLNQEQQNKYVKHRWKTLDQVVQ